MRYKCYVTIYFIFSKCAIAIGTLEYVRVGYCVNIILHVFMHLKNACIQRDFKEHNHLIKYQYTFLIYSYRFIRKLDYDLMVYKLKFQESMTWFSHCTTTVLLRTVKEPIEKSYYFCLSHNTYHNASIIIFFCCSAIQVWVCPSLFDLVIILIRPPGGVCNQAFSAVLCY